LGDLESGQSRLHDTNSNDNNTNIKAGVDDLARAEGERIGVEWRLSSKWTSFIVMDDGSSLEKPSRWYRAERSNLAELTRPRFGAANYDFPMESGITFTPSFDQSIDESFAHPFDDSRAEPRYCLMESRREGSGVFSRKFYAFQKGLSLHVTSLSPDSLPASSAEFGGLGRKYTKGKVPGAHSTGAAPSAGSSQDTQQLVRLDQPMLLRRGRLRERLDPYRSYRLAREAILSLCRPLVSAPRAMSESLTDNRTPIANSIRPKPSSFLSGSQIDSAFLSSPRSPIQDLTLGVLLDSSAATGAFILSPDLRTALKAKFKPSMRKSIGDWSATALREGARTWDMDEILDTAMPVVYIEEAFTSDKKLWSLVVQKARAWLKRFLVERRDRKSLFAILKKELRDGPQDINVKTAGDARMAVHSSIANVEGEAHDVLPSAEAPGQGSTESPSKKLVIEHNERDLLDVPKQTEGKGGEDPKR
jgi:hypothetical protein